MKRKSFPGTNYDSILKSTRTYYDEYSADYVKFYERWSREEGEFSDPKYKEGYQTVAEVLTDTATPGERVIDVGCGVGKWSVLLAEKGVQVTSADNLASMLRKLAQIRKQHGAKSKISPILSDGFFLPFREEAFDGATLNWVLAHIPVIKNEHFMNEVSRVVKCGGWLFHF